MSQPSAAAACHLSCLTPNLISPPIGTSSLPLRNGIHQGSAPLLRESPAGMGMVPVPALHLQASSRRSLMRCLWPSPFSGYPMELEVYLLEMTLFY